MWLSVWKVFTGVSSANAVRRGVIPFVLRLLLGHVLASLRFAVPLGAGAMIGPGVGINPNLHSGIRYS
jgi:hypothetical protein